MERKERILSAMKKYNTLLPKNRVDLSGYQEALDYAMKEERVRNIAITGSYGSGKSSVLNSYESIHGEKKFIHISLAHFKEQRKSADIEKEETVVPVHEEDLRIPEPKRRQVQKEQTIEGQSSEKVVNILEGKILNQLLHQIPLQKIPQSHFRVKEAKATWKTVLEIGLFILFVLIIMYLSRFDAWISIVKSLKPSSLYNMLAFSSMPVTRIAAGLIGCILAFFGIYELQRTHNFQNLFKKIDLKGVVGIEMFEADGDSYFDKYLNEVIYLFEHSGAYAVVFEDLDRYEATVIFEKLREISELLYRRELARTKQQLYYQTVSENDAIAPKFVYLIRDDVFTSSDRNKFFDFIIPIVPIVDATNSTEKLMETFEEMGLQQEFEERFLRDVSLYIGDMRLIANVVNEYVIYRDRLCSSVLPRDPNKQLAIIIYKNLYPKDFALLQKGRGFVYEVLKRKDKILEKLYESIDEKVAEKHQEINLLTTEKLRSIEELNALYFPLVEQVQSIDGTIIPATMSRVEIIERVLAEGVVSVRIKTLNGTETMDIPERRNRMDQNPEYAHRKALLEERGNQGVSRRQAQINELETKKRKLSILKFSELVGLLSQDEIIWDIKLPVYEEKEHFAGIIRSREFNLLKYFIREGYIEEDYDVYASYYYADSLSTGDKNFLLSLANHEKLPYDYRLNAPVKVLEKLVDADFIREEVCNFDLLRCAINGQSSYLSIWFNSLEERFESDKNSFSFIIDYWRNEDNQDYKSRFVKIIGERKPAWLKLLIDNNILLGNEWREFVVQLLVNVSEDSLCAVDNGGWLGEMISEDAEFFRDRKGDEEKIICGLRALNVQFKHIFYCPDNHGLIQKVYEENLYELNYNMIVLWLSLFWTAEETEIKEKGWTLIQQTPEEHLSLRIEKEIETYVSVIIEASEQFNDIESSVLVLLNNGNLSDEKKLAYIKKMNTVVSRINDIKNDSLWSALLQGKKAQWRWENIIDYFKGICEEGVFDTALIDFVNWANGSFACKYDDIIDYAGVTCAEMFLDAAVRCNEICTEKYREILARISPLHQEFLYEGLTSEHVLQIVDLKLIAMTAKNVEIMRKQYPLQLTQFIIGDIERYVELAEECSISLEKSELVELFECGEVSDSYCVRLLEAFNEDFPCVGKKYAAQVKVEIINNYFDIDEIELFLRTYECEAEVVQTAFENFAKSNMSAIETAAEYEEMMPVKLYAKCLGHMDENQAKKMRRLLADERFEQICTQNVRPLFLATEENLTILNYFKKKGWISSISQEVDGKCRVFPKTKLYVHSS